MVCSQGNLNFQCTKEPSSCSTSDEWETRQRSGSCSNFVPQTHVVFFTLLLQNTPILNMFCWKVPVCPQKSFLGVREYDFWPPLSPSLVSLNQKCQQMQHSFRNEFRHRNWITGNSCWFSSASRALPADKGHLNLLSSFLKVLEIPCNLKMHPFNKAIYSCLPQKRQIKKRQCSSEVEIEAKLWFHLQFQCPVHVSEPVWTFMKESTSG